MRRSRSRQAWPASRVSCRTPLPALPFSGARVVVSNESKGITRNLESNASGLFTAPSLVPAPGYSVTVNATGFAQYERKDMVLLVGQNLQDLLINLQVAAAAQTIDVTSGAPIVETTKTGVSQVVNTNQID